MKRSGCTPKSSKRKGDDILIIYYSTEFGGGRPESRRLLEEAFARHTGDPGLASELISRIQTGEKGKPYIDGFCHFSVSHTADRWAVLICGRECGLDMQIERKADLLSIAGRVYAEADFAALAEEPERSRQDMFFRVWTRREALAKALGGSVFDTDLPPVLPGHAEVRDKGFSVRSYRIFDIDPADGLFNAGASEGPSCGNKLYAAACVREDAGDGPLTEEQLKTVRIDRSAE